MNDHDQVIRLIQEVEDSKDFPGAMDTEERLGILLRDQRAEVDRLQAENDKLVKVLLTIGHTAADSVAHRFNGGAYVSDVMHAEES